MHILNKIIEKIVYNHNAAKQRSTVCVVFSMRLNGKLLNENYQIRRSKHLYSVYNVYKVGIIYSVFTCYSNGTGAIFFELFFVFFTQTDARTLAYTSKQSNKLFK